MNTTQTGCRVLVAEDNADLSAAVCELINAEPDMQVVASIGDTQKLLQTARDAAAHVVVLDLNLAGESSVPAMKRVQSELPDVAVVIYSGYDHHDIAGALASLGRCEYVSKTGDPGALLAAIRRVVTASPTPN
jgi:DNA-binding NarL/FixJ family response regulator